MRWSVVMRATWSDMARSVSARNIASGSLLCAAHDAPQQSSKGKTFETRRPIRERRFTGS
jgi:hypothetical protein